MPRCGRERQFRAPIREPARVVGGVRLLQFALVREQLSDGRRPVSPGRQAYTPSARTVPIHLPRPHSLSLSRRFQPKFAPGLRASLRLSKFRHLPTRGAHPAPFDHSPPESTLSSSPSERLSFCEDDLLDIDPDDLPAAAAFSSVRQPAPRSPVLSFESHFFPLIFRPRISVSRVKDLTPPSAPEPPAHCLTDASDYANSLLHTQRESEINSLSSSPTAHADDYLAFPRFSAEVRSIGETSFTLHDNDPFRKDESFSESLHPRFVPVSPIRVSQAPVDPNCIPPSPPATRAGSPSTITPSLAISSAGNNPFRKGLQRLRTLTRTKSLLPHHKPPVEPSSNDQPADSATPTRAPHFLPEFSFDSEPLLDFTPFELLPGTPVDSARHETLPPSRSSLEGSRPEPSFPLVKWERVDPSTLTPSPYAPTTTVSPDQTPLLIPSPSWLSRNTIGIDPYGLQHPCASIQVTPPSPAPLPILPRSLLPVHSRYSAPPSPSVEVPQSDSSSLTLYSPGPRRPSGLTLTIPGQASVDHLSVPSFRNSFTDNRRSIQSFLTYASLALGDHKDSPLVTLAQESPAHARFLLLLHPPSNTATPIDSAKPSPLPLPLRLSFGGINRSESRVNTPIEVEEHTYQVYKPPQRAFDDSKDTFPLPNYLRALIRTINRNSKSIATMTTVYGKEADTVDWGDEVDYSGYEWFKDPPPPPQAAPPPPVVEPYVPQPGVIEQNEMFDYALKSAPNVLFSRYKQYGQLGVLAWCSEFSELIDSLKLLGFDGNMFVSTRTQALKTCEDILLLNLEIEMQIIVMYLSSQVARLRRFLDSDRQWEDYPQPKFPVDPHIDYSHAGPAGR